MIVAGTLFILLSTLWACPALAIRGPARGARARQAMAWLWGAFGLVACLLLWSGAAGVALGFYAAAFAGMLGWWFSVRPSHDRPWADEVARLLVGEVRGDHVTLRNVRNFRWHAPAGHEARWETRDYDLGRLRTVDTALSYWGGPTMAHTLVSFGFEDGEYVTFSIEIRKKQGERFSAIGGLFRRFEASLVAADERDILGVRTNVRGEDVYLYRIAMPQEAMRSLFLAYVGKAEELVRAPRFYNTFTANCTTVVYEMVRRIIDGLPFDYRLLLSGHLPGYLMRVEGLVPGYDLPTLRAAGRITERARAAGDAADFSVRIRQGVPGYDAQGRPIPAEASAGLPAV
jgi:hypothetical protein